MQPITSLSEYDELLGEPVDLYTSKLKLNNKKGNYTFNEGYTPGGEVSGDSSSPRITATFGTADEKGAVTVTDPYNEISMTITPKFSVAEPKKFDNRIAYQIPGTDAIKVYTVQASGVKEDVIISEEPEEDSFKLEYDVSLPEGVELRMEDDGSIGGYGVMSTLLGNVTAGTEADAELLSKARANGEKNNLVFKIPAPFIVESDQQKSSARAWFGYENNKLTLYASGLKSANYPISIDPTIYVETAAKLMRGNNETNTDFDTTNELIQKSQTTGARIDGWADSTDMAAGLWDHSVASAGGFVYRAGGRIDPTIPYIVGSQQTQVDVAGGTFAMNMPTIRPAGDLYVAVISRVGAGTITPPAGWLLYSTGTNATTATRDVAIYYRIGVGSEPASYSWSNSTNVQWTGVIIRIKGFNSGTPISATAAASTGTATAAAPPIYPAVTPAQDATLVIRAVGINEVDPTDYTWLPSGHTRVHSSTSIASTASSTGLVVSTLDAPPLATVSTGTTSLATDGILTGNYGAISFAIRPATVTAGYQSDVEWAQINSSTSSIDSPNPGSGTCSSWCTSSSYALPGNRVGMSMVAYNGYLYAIGGTTNGTAANGQNNVWIAKLGVNGEPQLWHPTDSDKDNWLYWYQSSNVLPAALSYTSVAAYENRLYLVGGRNTSGNSINDVRVADFRPNGDIEAWTTTNMQNLTTPSPRYGHSVHIYNDVMYIIGGSNSGTLLNTAYYSKLDANGDMSIWTQTTSFTTPRQSFGGQMTSVWGAYIYLAGGCTAVTSGFCSTIASDVQLASINADGTLGPWNSILTLSNQRIGYSFVAWQGGLYRLGGCNRQNTTTGVCYATHRNVEFGLVNPSGDASTVSNSEPSGTSPCSGGSPINCDLPPAGDNAGEGGQMSSMVVINNGFIYNIGGCGDPTTPGTCNTGNQMSGNVSYAALNSLGQMVSPANCPNTTYGLWCVDSTNRVNGTAGIGAAAATVFNNTVYVVGGTNGGGTWRSQIHYTLLNADGSLAGGDTWTTGVATGTTGLPGTFTGANATGTTVNLGASGIGYGYAFTRANPGSAGSTPGNLYYMGGCVGNGGIACAGAVVPAYSNNVYKCNISTTGAVTGCTTTGQMQIDSDNINTGSQGLGLMAGTVYANRVYLVGGACGAHTGAVATDPCGATYSANRRDTIYARIDASNNIVDNVTGLSGGTWKFTTGRMNPVRRRAVAFGYNGYIYSLAGYSGTASLQDLLFAKIDVSTGDMGNYGRSGVVVRPRWDLRAVVSNGYVYTIGGCGGTTAVAPTCSTNMEAEIQTFQLYNNDSGAPISYTPSANLFSTDRMGASSTIMNGFLYVAGGCTSTTDCTAATDSTQVGAMDVYGNITGWIAGGNLPFARAWGQLENAGGTLYFIGGQESTATNESADVYYSSAIAGNGSPTWAGATNDLPAARTKHSAVVWDSRIYVIGGLNDTATATTSVYISPKLNSGGDIGSAWTTSSSVFNIARSGHASVAYANNLYILGGMNGSGNYLNDVQFASIGYKTGTISQSGTTVTGTGTSWTTSMVGSILQYRDSETATIQSVNVVGQTMVVDLSKTVPGGTQYTILDGSVGSWSYTTSLPEPITQADSFAANGYVYLVGGRSNTGDCVPNTLLAPISANTTIVTGNNPTGVGEWYETNVKYSGDRYGNSVSYSNGKYYVTGGACEKTPTVSSVTTSNFGGTNSLTHNLVMPAVVDAGDLLLGFFAVDIAANTTNITDPDGAGGWTQVATVMRSNNNIRGSVWAKDADGSEDGATVNFATNVSETVAAQLYRIPASNWDGNIASVEAATFDPGATTNSPNPAALNPAGWGAENTLWLAFVAGSSYATTTTYPTNYTNPYHTTSGTGTTGATATSSRRELNTASEDPGAYTMASNSNGVAITVGIRPAAFAYTGANRAVQTAVYSQPQVASYSRLIDTDTNVFPNSWLVNGIDNSTGARWRANYRSSADTSNIVFHESLDDGTNGVSVNGTSDGGTNSDYASCYNNNGTGTASHVFSNAWSSTASLSQRFQTTGGTGSAACKLDFADVSTSVTRFDRFYINVPAMPATGTVVYEVWDTISGAPVAQLELQPGGTLQLKDRFTNEDTVTLGTGESRVEVGILNDQMTVRIYSGANLHTENISDSDIISLDLGANTYDEIRFGIVTSVNTWTMYIDEHKASQSAWVGSAYPNWGNQSTYSDVIMGDVQTYIPLDTLGADTDFARWYFFQVTIDASQTFGYPEDVNRGPTISDLSLFFTSDPNKRLRHGKTFTGGEQQPLDTPCRQAIDAQCPLP